MDTKKNEPTINDLFQARIKALLTKPKRAQKDTSPKNKLWVSMLGFNVTMGFLDLISAVTVGILTNWLYGVLTFVAGFAALLLHESLFTNPFAGSNQKIMAVVGGIIAVISTVGIGVLAGIANVVQITDFIPAFALDITIIITLVVIAGIHGVIWGTYFFTDSGHVASMQAMANKAYRTLQRTQFNEAKEDLTQVKTLMHELSNMSETDMDLLAVAYQENTGRNLFGDIEQEQNEPETVPENKNGREPEPVHPNSPSR
jgi:hypothetical protein